MKSRSKQQARNSFSFSNCVGLFFLLAAPAYFVYVLSSGYYEQQKLENSATTIVAARVTSERHYFGNSPVTQQFSYGYEFSVQSKLYSGDTRDPALRPGNSIQVKYVTNNPDINSPVK
ncbi:MAG TPA: hypothetical protein VF690_21095 [Hymenobacter sp.]|jgi:hypothetical protein